LLSKETLRKIELIPEGHDAIVLDMNLRYVYIDEELEVFSILKGERGISVITCFEQKSWWGTRYDIEIGTSLLESALFETLGSEEK
jgi:hypothetical protein